MVEETFEAKTMVRLNFEIPDCKLSRGQMLSEISGGVIRIQLEEIPGGEGVSADFSQYYTLADSVFRTDDQEKEFCGELEVTFENEYSFIIFNHEE